MTAITSSCFPGWKPFLTTTLVIWLFLGAGAAFAGILKLQDATDHGVFELITWLYNNLVALACFAFSAIVTAWFMSQCVKAFTVDTIQLFDDGMITVSRQTLRFAPKQLIFHCLDVASVDVYLIDINAGGGNHAYMVFKLHPPSQIRACVSDYDEGMMLVEAIRARMAT